MHESATEFYRWLVDASLRLCLVLPPVMLLGAISRRTPSAVVCLLLATGLGVAIMTPWVGGSPLRITLPALEMTRAYEEELPVGMRESQSIAAAPLPPRKQQPGDGGDPLPLAVAGLWAAGALFFLLRRGWQYLSLAARFARARQVPAEHPASRVLESVAGVRKPWLFHDPNVPGPALQGLIHPRLLVSSEFLDRPAASQELVFRHELAHLSRFDTLTRAGLEVAAVVFWFHPLVHLMLRQYDLAVEMACDDAVLDGGIPADRYGEALIAEAKGSQGGRRLMRETKRRLWSVVRADKRRDAPSFRTGAGYALFFSVALVPLALIGFSPYPRQLTFKPLAADERLGAWWRMRMGRGELVDDWSGHGRHGRIVGASWVVDSQRGDCLSFDGKDDILVLPSFESDWTEGPFSLAVWIKLPPGADGGGLLLRGDFNQTWSAAMAHMGDSVFRAFGERELHLSGKHGPDGGADTFSPGRFPTFDAFGIKDDQAWEALPTGRWTHLALVVEPYGYEREVRFYIDARPAGILRLNLQKAAFLSRDWAADYWYFGRGEAPPVHGNHFEGTISDLAVFNVALTRGQVMMAMEGNFTGLFDQSQARR